MRATTGWALAALLALSGLGGQASAQQRLTSNITTDPAAAVLVTTDIENFIQAQELLAKGGDPREILEKHYLDRATPGLRMFIQKYDLTVERLVAAMEKHPDKYAALPGNLQVLRSMEPAFREAYTGIKAMVPNAVFPPTWFLVAGHRGIGSGSTEGPLISVEKETSLSIRGDLAATLVHEMIHMEQLAALDEAYFEIFNGSGKSLLALSVREGIATWLSEEIVGGSEHKNAARDYLLPREKEIWERFSNEMLGSETGEWLWSQPENPDQPQDLGYAIGARIARAYYLNATDKAQAIREILGVTDYPAFIAASGYEESLDRPGK